ARRNCGGVGDHFDDGKGRRASGGMPAQRSAHCLGAAHRRRRAAGSISRLDPGTSRRATSNHERTTNTEQRTTSNDQPAASNPKRATSSEPRVKHRVEYIVVRALIGVM